MYAMVGEITTLTGILGAGRLDSALAAALPQYSRARIQALISDAALRINGQIFADAGSKKMSGQTFELNIPAPVPDKAIAQDIALDIVFEDEHLIIVNKPAGLVVHPAAGHSDGTLVNALLHHCHGKLSGIGGVQRPGIVHRIDKDTSGLLVVAKSDAAHEGLAKLFAAHDIERKYIAIVSGIPAPPAGTVRTQIGRSTTNRKKMAVLPDSKGRHAVTHYRMAQAFAKTAMVECTLEQAARIRCASIWHISAIHSLAIASILIDKTITESVQIKPNSTGRHCMRPLWGLFIPSPAEHYGLNVVYQKTCSFC